MRESFVFPAPSRRQATLAGEAALAGRGLHTGEPVRVRLRPGSAGTGIIFHRKRPDGSFIEVAADWRRRVAQPLCTALQAPDGALVRTVEHLLAAFSAFAIDNAVVEMDAEELPIFDGSAEPWCNALIGCGRRVQDATRPRIKLVAPFRVQNGKQVAELFPTEADCLVLSVGIDLKHFGRLAWAGQVTAETFYRELSRSRSFGRLKWVLPLKAYALVTGRPVLRGAGLRNAAALWGGRIVGGARLPAEPARHRALDFVGDMALAGAPIVADVRLKHPGHDFNHHVLSQLMARPDAWVRD